MARLFRQFSFPGGVPSHVAPETPGSIHEGGELGYSLSHAYGAAFDNPDLVVACVVGDGEAETGPLATSWHSNKFLDPVGDGAVLPILHLNGYKIANPTVLARIPEAELDALLRGYGYEPCIVDRATTRPACTSAGRRAGRRARPGSARSRASARGRRGRTGHRRGPRWPMIVLRTPKGWTGPAEVDGLPVEGTWRAHQVPLAAVRTNPDAPAPAGGVAALLPAGGAVRRRRAPARRDRWACVPARRPAAWAPTRTPTAACCCATWPCPTSATTRCRSTSPGATHVRADPGAGRAAARRDGRRNAGTRELPAGRAGRDRVQPARTRSTRSPARPGRKPTLPVDEHLAADGRVMEILSEHTCQGWLEGYLLTGRHGLFSCYEAFIHIVDSMFNQHAKWLKVTRAAALAAAHRVAELPAHLARVAAGPQRLLATRTRASSTTW